MAIITRDQPRKGFYPYAARNSSLAAGSSNGASAGLLLTDYFTADPVTGIDGIIPAKKGFVYVVDRIMIRAIHITSDVNVHDSVVTIRITNGTTTTLLPFKMFRQDLAGGDYAPTIIDWKVNGKLVLKEGFNLNAKVSNAALGGTIPDCYASLVVSGEYVQVEEARQRGLLDHVYVGSIHSQANGANVTVVPKINGKNFIIDGFYVVGSGATNDAIENLTLRFSSADDGSGTNVDFMRYSSRRSEQMNAINHGTSDCFVAGPAGYGITAVQSTSKKFSAIIIGRYVKDTGQYQSVNANLKRFGDRFWFYSTLTGANTPTYGITTKPGMALAEGYCFSGSRIAAGTPSSVCLGYSTFNFTPTIYAGPDWDANALVDNLGIPALNSAEPKGLVIGDAWAQGALLIWGRHISDKTANYRFETT